MTARDSVAGRVAIERREHDVRGHDHRQAAVGRARGTAASSTALEPIPRVIDARQLEVAVGRGVAVPGEVLAAREDARRRRGRARTRARGARPVAASVPNARSPMIGFAGLVWTSSTGAKSMSKPSARSSSPIARPTCSAIALVVGRRAAVVRHIGGHMRRRRAHALHERRLLDRPRSAPACRRARARCSSLVERDRARRGRRPLRHGPATSNAEVALEQDRRADLAGVELRAQRRRHRRCPRIRTTAAVRRRRARRNASSPPPRFATATRATRRRKSGWRSRRIARSSR